jgi:hypothetical protein
MSGRIGAILCEIMKGEVDVVESFLQAIETWYCSVSNQFEERAAKLQNTRGASEYDWDAISDERGMADRVRRAMYPCIAVSLFAVAEQSLFMLCVNSGLLTWRSEHDASEKSLADCQGHKVGRPDWGIYRKLIEGHTGVLFDRILCFRAMDRVRRLNNCFKHSDGTVTEEFRKVFGGNLGDEIQYESENWNELISGCRTFLESVVAVVLDQKKQT